MTRAGPVTPAPCVAVPSTLDVLRGALAYDRERAARVWRRASSLGLSLLLHHPTLSDHHPGLGEFWEGLQVDGLLPAALDPRDILWRGHGADREATSVAEVAALATAWPAVAWSLDRAEELDSAEASWSGRKPVAAHLSLHFRLLPRRSRGGDDTPIAKLVRSTAVSSFTVVEHLGCVGALRAAGVRPPSTLDAFAAQECAALSPRELSELAGRSASMQTLIDDRTARGTARRVGLDALWTLSLHARAATKDLRVGPEGSRPHQRIAELPSPAALLVEMVLAGLVPLDATLDRTALVLGVPSVPYEESA